MHFTSSVVSLVLKPSKISTISSASFIMQDGLIVTPSLLGPSVLLKIITTFPRDFRVKILTSSSLPQLYLFCFEVIL